MEFRVNSHTMRDLRMFEILVRNSQQRGKYEKEWMTVQSLLEGRKGQDGVFTDLRNSYAF